MEADRWLRPRARLALITAGLVAGFMWVFLAAATAFAALWWPEHAILKNSVTGWFRGTAILSAILCSPVAGCWLRIRRVTWRIGSGGIEVYRRGMMQRCHGWGEITRLDIWLSYVGVHTADRMFPDEMYWLAAEDVSWLREVASARPSGKIIN